MYLEYGFILPYFPFRLLLFYSKLYRKYIQTLQNLHPGCKLYRQGVGNDIPPDAVSDMCYAFGAAVKKY